MASRVTTLEIMKSCSNSLFTRSMRDRFRSLGHQICIGFGDERLHGLHWDLSFGLFVYDIFAANGAHIFFQCPVPVQPVIQVRHPHQIQQFNGFGCPVSSCFRMVSCFLPFFLMKCSLSCVRPLFFSPVLCVYLVAWMHPPVGISCKLLKMKFE